jgi:hypothetical protein
MPIKPVTVIAKGPLKNVQRAAARYDVPVSDCRAIGGDVQCHTLCSAEANMAEWFSARGRVKQGRGFPPGTLLYYSGKCGTRELGTRRSRKRTRRR